MTYHVFPSIGHSPLVSTSSLATPALVQMVSSSTNVPNIQGTPGGYFKFTLPNASQTGNCIILMAAYDSGATVGVIDNLGNTWGAAAASADGGGAGNTVAAIWVLPNNASSAYGTFHFTSTPITGVYQYIISEWCNISTSNPVNGSATATNVAGSALATGAYTPTTNNDANGGNLILSYFCLAGDNFSGTPTHFTKGTSQTLLATDVMPPTQCFGFLGQYLVQTTRASINPSCTAPTGATDSYNCVSVALKVASAGSPKPAAGSGVIWINSIQHFSTTGAPATWTVRTPSIGDMRTICVTNGAAWSVADSDSSSYTSHGGNADGITAIVWETAGKSANNDLTVSMTTTGGTGANQSMRYYDISNAANPPFDLRTFVNTGTGNVDVRNDFPDITPTTSNGLVIVNGANGLGPTTGFNTGVPANAVFDLCWYGAHFTATISGTVMNVSSVADGKLSVGDAVQGPGVTGGTTISSFGTGSGGTGTYNLSASSTVGSPTLMTCGETDGSSMENADTLAHYFNPNTNQITWNFSVANTAAGANAISVAYKHG